MTTAALLLAAGRGERLGAPKGFVQLEGRPLLALALETVRRCASVDVIVVLVPAGDEVQARELAGPDEIVAVGGDSRQASVRAGLDALDDLGRPVDAVVVHDVARPLAPSTLFDEVIAGLGDADGVVPGVPVTDTVKRLDDGVVAETLPREALVAVQTPQAFRLEALRRAHELAAKEGFLGTDDASLLERAGMRVVVVPGDPRNVKITEPHDLAVASLLAGPA
jgi:2-C-methyl-D-erythritol 4-phosphate cytidylyltransferase